MYDKKGQAAMEFLTTYGWAFLIIIVAVAGLSYFGVFSFGKYLPTTCSFDGKLECGSSFAVTSESDTGDNSSIMFQLKNNYNSAVTITNITWIEKSLDGIATVCYDDNAFTGNLAVGKFTDIFAEDANNADECGARDNIDQKKSFNVKVYHTTAESNIELVSTGTITTTVQKY